MIQEFVNIYNEHKDELKQAFTVVHPSSYSVLVSMVISFIATHLDDIPIPDSTRVTEIDDGDYQGTLVYVIGAKGYQPYDYWYVKVFYGSCGSCDTLQGILEDGSYNAPPTSQQTNDYMSLALHIIQGLKKMD